MYEEYREYGEYAIDLVRRNFQVSREELKRSHTKKAVDARCALVHILDFQGVDALTIKEWTGFSENTQSNLLQTFQDRKDEGTAWFDIRMIRLIRDAKLTCPIPFKAHNKNGEVVEYDGAFE